MKTLSSSTVDQAIDNANENSQEIVDNNSKLMNDCFIAVPETVNGPSFMSTVPDSEMIIEGKSIVNKNVKSGEIRWMGNQFFFGGKQLSINIQATAMNRLRRLQQRLATNINGMLLIHKDDLGEYNDCVKVIKDDFLNWRDEIFIQHDDIMTAHQKNNPDIAGLIIKHSLSKDQTRGRYSFTEAIPLAITLARKEDEADFKTNAANGLWADIAKIAKESYQKSFAGKSASNQKAKSVMKMLQGKLMKMAFMDERIVSVLDAIDDVLNKLPKVGKIEGGDFQTLARWTLVMADEDALKAHIAADDEVEESEPETIKTGFGDDFEVTSAENISNGGSDVVIDNQNITSQTPEESAEPALIIADEDDGWGSF